MKTLYTLIILLIAGHLNAQIIYVNDKFCQTSGYTREELMGQNHNIIRHPDTPTSLFVNMWNALIKGKVWQNTFKNKNKKGEEYYVKAVMIPIFDKKGKIIEYISIRTDVSEIFLKDKIINCVTCCAIMGWERIFLAYESRW